MKGSVRNFQIMLASPGTDFDSLDFPLQRCCSMNSWSSYDTSNEGNDDELTMSVTL
jgi:hypothetical protein